MRVLKTQRSRARSGRLERHVRRSGILRSGCAWHAPTTPAWNHTGTTGVWSGSHPAQDHALHNGPASAPRASGSTFSTTGFPHHGRSYHTLHHGQAAPRAFVPHPTPRAPARRSWHHGRSGSAIRRINSKKGVPITRPGRRTVWRSAAASAPQKQC